MGVQSIFQNEELRKNKLQYSNDYVFLYSNYPLGTKIYLHTELLGSKVLINKHLSYTFQKVCPDLHSY